MAYDTTGLPSSDNYLLGRGEVLFAELDANDLPINFRDLGNATAVAITREVETLEHTTSRAGTAVVDKEVITSTSSTVTISLDEAELQNLGLFLAGGITASQSNAAAVAGVTGSGNLTLPASNAQGRWYDLYQGATGAPASNPYTARIYDIGTVTFGTAGTGSVEGTDFNVDKILGRIFIIEGSTILVAGASYDVDIAANAGALATVPVLKAQTASTVVGAIKFKSINPANDDAIAEYTMHKVTVKPTGDLALIGDEFAVFQLEGKLESNPAADVNSPFMTVVDLDGAGT